MAFIKALCFALSLEEFYERVLGKNYAIVFSQVNSTLNDHFIFVVLTFTLPKWSRVWRNEQEICFFFNERWQFANYFSFQFSFFLSCCLCCRKLVYIFFVSLVSDWALKQRIHDGLSVLTWFCLFYLVREGNRLLKVGVSSPTKSKV